MHATFHMPGQEYLFASFHGEDHARGTDVVLNALYKLAETMPAHRLVVRRLRRARDAHRRAALLCG